MLEEIESLKKENKELLKKEQSMTQDKFLLEEKYRDLESQWEDEKNNHEILVQGYQEKIKSQGEIIEESLRRIRKLEGLDSGYDDYEDEYEYYVESN